MFRVKCVSFIYLLIYIGTASAQTDTPIPVDIVKSNDSTSVLLLINEEQPSQIIIYDNKGNWLYSVKEITVTVDFVTNKISANCVSWKGTIKPLNPKIFTAEVKELKSVKSTVFQEKLNELNME